MSKNSSRSIGSAGSSQKNTLLQYFPKSPAMIEKKKMPKTPIQETDPVSEKENVAGAKNSPTVKAGGSRSLEKEFKKVTDNGSHEEKNEESSHANDENKDDDDDGITSTRKAAKRRRIVIPDSDSSGTETTPKKKNFFADSDDDDSDKDYKASSNEDEESDNVSVSSSDNDEKSQNLKRRSKIEQSKKKIKLQTVPALKGTVLEKLKTLQELAANSNNDPEKYEDILKEKKDDGYDEPVSWPHHKLEFLKPEKIKDKQGRRPDHPEYDPSTLYVPQSFLDSLSPGVRQWWVLKSNNFDCVLFFKVGKFYELYHMDADVGVNELGFTYMRGEFAHSGFPEVSFDKMSSILIDRGYKIARVEQTETPDMMAERCKKIKATKFDKVVRREICQISNRGTQVFGSQCEITANHQPSYMLAIVEKMEDQLIRYGISYIDTSIGDFYVSEFTDDKNSSRLLTLLSHHMPVLVIYEKSSLGERTQQVLRTVLANVLKEQMPNSESQRVTAEKILQYLGETYYVSANGVDNWPAVLHSMKDKKDRLGLTPHADYKLALKAIGLCVNYMRKCVLEEKIMPMARFHFYTPPDLMNIKTEDQLPKNMPVTNINRHMVLDGNTLNHLRITDEEFSLQSTLDHCCTKFGKRLLHHWICAPSCDCEIIIQRQEAISELLQNIFLLQDLRSILGPLPDFERQLAQVHLFGSKLVAENHPDGRAILFEEKQYNKKKLRNFIALLDGFKGLEKNIPRLFKDCKSFLLRHLTQYPVSEEEGEELMKAGGIYPNLKKPLEFFETSFDHSSAAETGVIAPEKGIDPDYDEAMLKIEAVQKKLKSYLAEQEKHFGCKVSYFGSDKKRFQIEVPEKMCHKATAEYQLEGQRKGSNPVKRYTTEMTKSLLRQMQNAEEDRNRVVKDLARRIFEKFSSQYTIWKQCVDCIAYLDVLGSLAEYAYMQNVICVPVVHPASSNPFIDIEDGFHPCMAQTTYVPNSICLGTKGMAPLSLLTGPNMGGKSTFMRQVGLLLVMAQIGSHVPAQRCEFTIIDRIFSRLGAQDDILAGQSTFMVEMSEASTILKHATIHSFVLMDELGRGTATYDGTAIAASVVKFLANLGCRTMFSTHYKHLTDSFEKDSRIQLGHMACMVENEDTEDPTQETVTFLYKYIGGACPKSYGFNAAKLAGMPHDVIKRGYQLSKEVEAIALKRKITKKIFDAAIGKNDEKTKTEDTISSIKNLLLQLKSCHV